MHVSVVCQTRLSALSLFLHAAVLFDTAVQMLHLQILRRSFVLSSSVVDEVVRCHCAT